MTIHRISLPGKVLLAPMAGVTDAPFRALCVDCGAAATVSEMVSAKAISLGDKTSLSIAERRGVPGMYGVQIFAPDPDSAGEAVKRLYDADLGADWFDLNCGCPAPKIVNSGCGSTLMKSPAAIEAIVAAMVAASPLPVTVKLRAGFDGEHVNAVDCAKAAEAAGASVVTVHGRTRDRMYAPPVDREIIRAVKGAVGVPVVGNGDIFTCDDAEVMLRETGCDALMVGRGALGRPWFFTMLNAFLQEGERKPEPSPKEKMEFLLRHMEALSGLEGEKMSMLKARKHAAWYTKGIRGAAAFRREMNGIETMADLREIARKVVEMAEDREPLPFTPPQVGNFT